MSEQSTSSPDLSRILHAWQAATVRLEQTHESLRSEVRRLTEELEQKNRELARKNRLADMQQFRRAFPEGVEIYTAPQHAAEVRGRASLEAHFESWRELD